MMLIICALLVRACFSLCISLVAYFGFVSDCVCGSDCYAADPFTVFAFIKQIQAQAPNCNRGKNLYNVQKYKQIQIQHGITHKHNDLRTIPNFLIEVFMSMELWGCSVLVVWVVRLLLRIRT